MENFIRILQPILFQMNNPRILAATSEFVRCNSKLSASILFLDAPTTTSSLHFQSLNAYNYHVYVYRTKYKKNYKKYGANTNGDDEASTGDK